MATPCLPTSTTPCAAIFEERAVVEVLACLRKYGQRLDVEIAGETGVPLEEVRRRLVALAATGAVITCGLTRFERGKRLDAWLCRVSGYVPSRAPGRKPTGRS
jgi:hypothetical protein